MMVADSIHFLQTLAEFYADYGRHDMAWRQPDLDGTYDPYKILVSEIMLQQTQVARVTPKYQEFLTSFPTVQALASVELGDVLSHWSGLGYNRRAKYLWQAAGKVMEDYGGIFPKTSLELQTLPGVGPNTAGAIMAYAYDNPVVYIETNIRTVLIYHFFQAQDKVTDKELRAVLELIVAELPDSGIGLSYRELYYAFMDYGSHLKKSVGNVSRSSASYARQSTFAGSRRQIRGQVIRLLTERPHHYRDIAATIVDDRLPSVLSDLTSEGLVIERNQTYSLH